MSGSYGRPGRDHGDEWSVEYTKEYPSMGPTETVKEWKQASELTIIQDGTIQGEDDDGLWLVKCGDDVVSVEKNDIYLLELSDEDEEYRDVRRLIKEGRNKKRECICKHCYGTGKLCSCATVCPYATDGSKCDKGTLATCDECDGTGNYVLRCPKTRNRMKNKKLEIVSIHTIKNNKLRERFEKEREMLEVKGDANVKQLFHGTSKYPPTMIYRSDTGFRKGTVGFFGPGCYFADNFDYSHMFTHEGGEGQDVPQGQACMLICDVVIGRSITEKNKQKKYQEAPPNCDSVKSTMDGTTMYVTYETKRIYPRYLVTYYYME